MRWPGLYVQVLIGIVSGIVLGVAWPQLAIELKPLGDAFIGLVRMLVAPILFFTIVLGIAGMQDTKRLGRVGLRALLYFELLTTLALLIGLAVGHLLQPGAGLHVDASKLDASGIASYTQHAAQQQGWVQWLVPQNFFGALAGAEVLQVLVVALLFGIALAQVRQRAQALLPVLDAASAVFMHIIHLVMRLAPLAACAAMGYTIGKFGLASLVQLGSLMLSMYLTCFVFIVFVLGGITWWLGCPPWLLLRYLRDELLIVLATSSSESVLPNMLEKMQRLGCERSIVGIVLPAGYSFNLDGTCIYLTMATVFIAQATDTPLTLAQQLSILGLLLLTSKGAATVTGGGFVTLAATLAATGTLPVQAMVLLLGIDRMMSEARAITNLLGNAVATLVVARWEGALDTAHMHYVLHHPDTAMSDTA